MFGAVRETINEIGKTENGNPKSNSDVAHALFEGNCHHCNKKAISETNAENWLKILRMEQFKNLQRQNQAINFGAIFATKKGIRPTGVF